jgi:hypothetical protein
VARPEVSGRKIFAEDDQARLLPPPIRGPPVAYTISEFCEAHRISRAQYYVLRKKGQGPDETHLGGRVIITSESAARWRKRHTRKHTPHSQPAA